MSRLKKGLALVLTLCMMLSLMPVITPSAKAADDDFYKIVHLDCGRKYFTVDWIKGLIDEMAEDGYNQLQLAFGNDGLRFLLDDMSFAANGTIYTHESVVSAVEAGNAAQNSSGDSSYLTESEMNAIIIYANSKNIEIVPLLNLPGHANAILDIANDAYNYSTSQNTLDVTSENAINFAMAIFQKYVDYFAEKGCQFFNFGADEFANDITSGSFSFGMMNESQYNSFVSFINSMASYIKEKGMTPRAFNDGLYYGEYTNVSIDTNIQCCYWSSGWGSYPVAPASTISDKDHDMINTNGDFYYVLGKNDNFDSGSSYADNWDNAKFMGTTFDSEQAGSMFCIWCDYPNAETQEQIYTKVVESGVLSAMSKAMGHMPESGGSTDPEDATVADKSTGVSVTAPGLTSVKVTEQPAVVSDNTVSKTYSITLNGGDYTDEATVRIPYDSAFDGCVSFSGMVGTNPFDVNRDGGYFVATVPHFSNVTITGTLADTGDDPRDTVTPGDGTPDSYVLDTDGLYADEQYLIVYKDSPSATSGVALKNDKGSLDVTISGNSATPAGDASAALWTYQVVTTSGWFEDTTNYYLKNGSNYLYPSRSWSGGWQYTLNIDPTQTSITVSNRNNGAYSISNTWNSSYVAYSNNVWGAQKSSQDLYFYKYTPGTASYKVEPALQESRIDALTVRNDGYTDESWNAYQSALNAATDKLDEVKSANYSSKAAANTALDDLIDLVGALDTAYNNLKKAVTITINYETEDGTPVKTETRKVAEGTTTITLSNVTGTDGEVYLPENYTLNLVNGQTTYTVTVTKRPFNPDDVTPLTIELWITNATVTANGAITATVTADDAYGKDGVAITDYAPAEGYKTNDGPTHTTVYWQSRILDRSKAEQTTNSGDDETTSGSRINYVRYYEGTWQTSADRVAWTAIPSNYQLIAYYLMYAPLTDEVTTATKDWGFKSGESWGYLDYKSRAVLSFQIVDESGTVFPSDGSLADSSWIYCLDGVTRNIGFIDIMTGNSEYDVYKVTYTMGSAVTSLSLSADGKSTITTINSLSYDVAANETLINENAKGLGSDITIDYTNTTTPQWTTSQNACLIRIYIKSKPSDDNLTVHYVNQATDGDFHSYGITVKKGTLFDENFTLNEDGTLSNNTVKNNVDHTVVVSADLSTMPTIDPAYRYSTYTCVSVTRSEDGKDVFLYYTFDNTHSFVVDFGLPLKITTDDLKISGSWTSASVSGAQYGTTNATVGEGVTYTPTETLKGVETLNLTLTDSNGSVTHTIYIYPATTVYYEEGFATYGDGWTGNASRGSGTQTTSAAGSQANYGYDGKYFGEPTGPSNNTEATSNAAGDKATFNFTGTGVDVYANCSPDTGAVMIKVKQGKNTVKAAQVLTALKKGTTDATQNQDKTGYNVPIVSFTDLNYGSYTVEITHIKTKNDTGDTIAEVKLDGFRVYGTMNNDALHQEGGVYYLDKEDNPTFIEMRDQVLAGLSRTSTGSGQVNAALPEDTTVAVVASSEKYTQVNVDDLLKNGPKNEIYLQPNQALVLKITTDREVQIGLKALNAATTYTIDNGDAKNIRTSTDMFYTVLAKADTTGRNEQTITITNNGAGILAVTKLKVCDDPNATLGTLTEEDLTDALVSLGIVNTAEEPGGSGGSSGGGGGNTPAEPTTPPTGLPFADVTTGDWFLDNVKYVYEKGLMNGTSDTAFSPKQTTNRAMIVTILHRLENSPAVDAQYPFADVAADQYYANPVAWAAANGIVTGTSETTFAPLNNITREQMAAILYRYAQFKGYDVSVGEDTNILSYADAETISEYAVPAIQWAVGSGLINGKGGGVLDPQGSATRAEVSAILARFCEAYAK